jgi:hypothetical protein
VYSPDGKFKTGTVAFEVTDVGYEIQIYESTGAFKDGGYYSNETFAAGTIRAVRYR